jgi:hypothetical protein
MLSFAVAQVHAQQASSYIWLEKPLKTNFNHNVPWPVLSEGNAPGLMPQGKVPDQPFVTYALNVPADATYKLWMRTFNAHWSSPARWRIDEQDWQEWKPGQAVDRQVHAGTFSIEWMPCGSVDLKAGDHTFTLETLGKRAHGDYAYFVMDVVLLTKDDYVPAGNLNPMQQISAYQNKIQELATVLPTDAANDWQAKAQTIIKQVKDEKLSAISQLPKLIDQMQMSAKVIAQFQKAEDPALHGNVNQVTQEGDKLIIQTQWNKAWEGDAWIGLLHEGQLYHTWIQATPKHSQQLDFTVSAPSSVVASQMQIIVAPLSQATSVSARGWWEASQTPVAKPTQRSMSWGIYKDALNVMHPWYINQAGAMIWDGKPYIPIGGMMNIRSTWQSKVGEKDDTGPVEIGLKIAEERLKLLKEHDLDDVFFNGSFIRTNPNALQRLVNLSEKYGMNYGLHISSRPEYSAWGYQASPDYFADVTAGQLVEINCKTGRRADVKFDVVDALWFAIDKDGNVIGTGQTKLNVSAKGKPREPQVLSGKIASEQLPTQAVRVRFKPCMPIPTNNPVGYVEHFESYLQRIKDVYGSLNLGPHFRMWIDPLNNEMHASPTSVPVSETFANGFKTFLLEQYGNVQTLNQYWKTQQKQLSWQQASHLVPLHSNSKTLWAIDYQSNTLVSFEDDGSAMLYDLKIYMGKVCRQMINDAAEALKSVADVPVVVKHNLWFSDWFVNDDPIRGIDGVGMEAYCYGDSLAYHNSLVVTAEAMQSKRTQWLLVTETSPAAFDGQKNYVGYRDRLQLHDDFDQMFMYGAKGMFTFGFSFDPPNNFLVTELVRDVRQLRWMQGYDQLVQANLKTFCDYQPELYGWYPANLREREIINQTSPRYAMDGSYLGIASQLRMAPDGRWIVPAMNPNAAWHKLIAAKPLMTDWMKQHLPAGENVIVLGDQTPLTALTSNGIGIISPEKRGGLLDEFQRDVLGYRTFQTKDCNGYLMPDGSILVWLATECKQGVLNLPASAQVTRWDGQPVAALTSSNGMNQIALLMPERKHITDKKNPPAYLPYGYYYPDDHEPEMLRVTGIGVDQLLQSNELAFKRVLPSTLNDQQVQVWREAESTEQTTFNVPMIQGFSDMSGQSMLGINTHDIPAVGYWEAHYNIKLDRSLSNAVFNLRRSNPPVLDIQVLIDGQLVGTISSKADMIDKVIYNPWNAGLGQDRLRIGWTQLALPNLAAGNHKITLRALPSSAVENEEKSDQKLIGQASDMVLKAMRDRRQNLNAVQIDAWMISQ